MEFGRFVSCPGGRLAVGFVARGAELIVTGIGRFVGGAGPEDATDVLAVGVVRVADVTGREGSF